MICKRKARRFRIGFHVQISRDLGYSFQCFTRHTGRYMNPAYRLKMSYKLSPNLGKIGRGYTPVYFMLRCYQSGLSV